MPTISLNAGAKKILALFISLTIALDCLAMDLAITYAPYDETDQLQEYIFEVLEAVMVETQNQFGPFKILYSNDSMARDRQFAEVSKGKNLTLMVSPPMVEWKGHTLEVPFPVQLGISSFRIFLIMKENENLLKNVNSLKELKKKFRQALTITGQQQKSSSIINLTWLAL